MQIMHVSRFSKIYHPIFPSVNHVTLSFTDFEVEMVYSDCSHDSVEILDGDNYQAPSVGKDYICSSRNHQ